MRREVLPIRQQAEIDADAERTLTKMRGRGKPSALMDDFTSLLHFLFKPEASKFEPNPIHNHQTIAHEFQYSPENPYTSE